MNLLESRFQTLQASGEKALVLFLTAGDQPLSQLPDLLKTLEDGGADAIEVGIPFSDPFGEGPTIQASSQRSLDQGTTVRGVLEAMAKAELSIPLLTMGYTNPVMRYGFSEFARDSRAAGSCGTILSDLTPDESDAWCAASADADLRTVFLVAPTSPASRIEEVAKRSTGFVYVVSRTGVTGAENVVPSDVSDLVRRVKNLTDKPACVGFGVSSPDHVRMVCEVADGAVVGSALVKKLLEEWESGAGANSISAFVQSLKAGTR
jgi:tryptophan synthase alpha chain